MHNIRSRSRNHPSRGRTNFAQTYLNASPNTAHTTAHGENMSTSTSPIRALTQAPERARRSAARIRNRLTSRTSITTGRAINGSSNGRTNGNPDVVIDLSETPINNDMFNLYNTSNAQLSDHDNDVVVVPSPHSEIIDLCTPVREVRRRSARNGLLPRSPQPYSSVTTSAQTDNVIQQSVQTSTTTLHSATEQTVNKKVENNSDKSFTDEQKRFMCPVCMECALKNNPTSTKCGHIFCETCIHHAIRATHRCPMCNTKLSSRMLIRIYL